MKTTVVITFDVDGTLECGEPKGPIKLDILRKLKEEKFTVGIVGAYQKVQKHIGNLDFYFGGDPHKIEHLSKVREMFKPRLALYVADRESDRAVALKTGFTYVCPEDFIFDLAEVPQAK